MNSLFAYCEVISTYTRADAIQDGTLIDITANYPDISRQLYKYPVACTALVYSVLQTAVASSRQRNAFAGIIWDLLWMSQKGIVERIDETQHIFRVVTTDAGPHKYHDFKIMCHPGDSLEPVLTILMPWED